MIKQIICVDKQWKIAENLCQTLRQMLETWNLRWFQVVIFELFIA